MREYQSLSHTKWECKYHVEFIPKCRRRKIYGLIWGFLGEVFHELARQKGCQILEGHLMVDHIHMCISIPPKYAVSNVVGFIKVKSAISIAREYRDKNNEVFKVKAFGHEVILYLQLVWTKRRSVITSKNRRKKMNDMISFTCGRLNWTPWGDPMSNL